MFTGAQNTIIKLCFFLVSAGFKKKKKKKRSQVFQGKMKDF